MRQQDRQVGVQSPPENVIDGVVPQALQTPLPVRRSASLAYEPGPVPLMARSAILQFGHAEANGAGMLGMQDQHLSHVLRLDRGMVLAAVGLVRSYGLQHRHPLVVVGLVPTMAGVSSSDWYCTSTSARRHLRAFQRPADPVESASLRRAAGWRRSRRRSDGCRTSPRRRNGAGRWRFRSAGSKRVTA